MYLINVLVQRGRDLSILNFVRNIREPEKAREYLAEIFSPELTAIIKKESLELIRKDIIGANSDLMHPRMFTNDFKTALGIFLLVFLSTFPVAIPFVFIKDVRLALRISNGIAILLLFLGGWNLARYSGHRKFRTGLIMALIGIGMVLLTILLGG
jgi:VIT1/CCC1 family predicted Fe2+/Mn2+ transporter